MAFISPEYLEQNKALHETRADYGAGSYRWAQQISALKDEVDAKTVLDYGCGKGMLRASLGCPDWLKEFDPAIPGKDKAPKIADLVVCTDVLEHVERSHIDNVLNHLWQLSKRALFLVISTRKSSKDLSDGRNAHLIVEDAIWWKQKLGQFFHVASWNDDGDEIVALAHKVYTPGDIKTVSAVSDDLRFEQVKLNIGKTVRRLEIQKRHTGLAVVAGFGPSLRDSISSIRTDRENGAVVVSVSGAHDLLIKGGIVPDIHIDVDPREHKGYFTRNPHPKIKYWMASCCHPSVIDNLLRYDLTLWHVGNSQADMQIVENLEPDSFLLGGGSAVGSRAVNIMYTQGYRRWSIYGMDCSFAENGDQHADFHSGKRQEEWRARCGDRWFNTSGTLISMAQSFIENQKALEAASKANNEPPIDDSGNCTETLIHGDGLLAAMSREISPQITFHREIGSRDGEDEPKRPAEAAAA